MTQVEKVSVVGDSRWLGWTRHARFSPPTLSDKGRVRRIRQEWLRRATDSIEEGRVTVT